MCSAYQFPFLCQLYGCSSFTIHPIKPKKKKKNKEKENGPPIHTCLKFYSQCCSITLSFFYAVPELFIRNRVCTRGFAHIQCARSRAASGDIPQRFMTAGCCPKKSLFVPLPRPKKFFFQRF